MKFRKKPVMIEAVPVKDILEFAAVKFMALPKWVVDAYEAGCFWLGNGYIAVNTAEGEMRGEMGDWLIREPFPTNGRLVYPCKPDIFEATYEAAE